MNQNQYNKASNRMEELLNTLTKNGELSTTQQQKLDLVSDAIADYEDKHFPFEPETLIEMIELRMFQRQLKQKDLARILDTNPSRISELLNGKRDLTMDMARGLYQKLNIDPDLILKDNN